MNIAVLFGEVGYISRSRILDGILDMAKKDNSNVVLYTCEGFLFHDMPEYIAGEYTIFKLPALENYDGVIFDLDSIQNQAVQDYIYQSIKDSGVPCVSFNKGMDIANEIAFDNRLGMKKLLEHLIFEHRVRDFAFISGPLGNRDAKERLAVFRETLAENDINFDEAYLFEGDFNFASGGAIARSLIKEGKRIPRAVVAADDYMAIGFMEELKAHGIRVPEDVIVTGYDNCEVADFTEPRLTTVDRCEYESGAMAYKKLLKNIGKSEENENIVIEGKPYFAASCGCKNLSPKSLGLEDTNSVVELKIHMDESIDLLKGLTIALSETNSLESFERSLEKYIEKMGMEFFYFCQCGSRESYYEELETLASGKKVRRNMKTYQETVWCPIAYENGEWNSYPKFSTSQLFPPKSKYCRENGYYIVMPVHQGEECIGYSIIGNFKNNLSGRVLQHLVLDIDQALGNIRKNDIMTTMLARINQKWQYDELTGLYNRSGMINNVINLIEQAVSEKRGLAVIFFDLDGLKAINDSLGHEAGDKYIKSMAEMLKAASTEDDVVTRYGGDEYIFISKQTSWDDSLKKLKEIQASIHPPVSASVGCSFGFIASLDELNGLIEEADKKMYEYKKENKRAR